MLQQLGDGIILNLMRTIAGESHPDAARSLCNRLPCIKNVTTAVLIAGTMRSGDLHNCTQFDVILAGRAKLVTYVRLRSSSALLNDTQLFSGSTTPSAPVYKISPDLLQDTVTQRETAMVYGRNDFIKIPARCSRRGALRSMQLLMG
jgi:hypothetical protein